MRKNVASQTVVAQLIAKADGTPVTTGSTEVYILGDGGTQTASGNSPSGALHEGQGVWSYQPTAAETNYDHVAFTFVNSSAINVTIQVYTSYPQTGDNYARIGAGSGSPTAQTLTDDIQDIKVKVDTYIDASVSSRLASASYTAPDNTTITNIYTRVGAATGSPSAQTITDDLKDIKEHVDTYLDATVSSRSSLDAAGIRTAVGLASANLDTQLTAIDDYIDTEVAAIKVVTDKLATTLTDDLGSPGAYQFTKDSLDQGAEAVWDVTRANHVVSGTFGAGVASIAPGGILSTSFASNSITAAAIADGAIDANTFAAGAINAAAIATDAIDADALAADAVAEIQSGLSTLNAAGVRAAVGLASANLDTQLGAIDDYIDTEVAAIKAVTDKLDTTLTSDMGSPGVYQFTADALDQAPSGTGASAATIASAVWEEARAGHVSAGTFGEGVLVATGGITAGSFAAGAIDATAIATDAIGANELAASAIAEIQSGLSTLTQADVRTAVGLASANLDTQLGAIDDYVDTEVAAIKLVTDKLDTTLTSDMGSPGVYQFTADALDQAPSASASAIATAVWDYVIENSTSALSFMRGFAATLLGKASGMGTTTGTFRDTADSKDRVVATIDADGNRSAVTLDLS